MGLFPCSHHGSHYRGPQQTSYPALVLGAVAYRQKQRLCPACFLKTEGFCRQHLVDAVAQAFDQACCICAGDDAPYGVFVTLYGTGEERIDYWGRACAKHALGEVAVALFGTEELQMSL